MDKHITVPVQLLRSFAVDVFIAVGVPHGDADICADVLITSDIRGIESHGMSRLKMYIDRILDGRQKPVTNLTIEKETPSTALIDGHDGMGAVISTKAMSLAIKKAKEVGTGTVAVRNSTHFGIAGYYPSDGCKRRYDRNLCNKYSPIDGTHIWGPTVAGYQPDRIWSSDR